MSAGLLPLVPSRSVSTRPGGEIARVMPGSPAEVAGLRAGDQLVAINGLVVRDAIDYAFATVDPLLDLAIERDGQLQSFQVEKQPDQELGLELVRPVFEGIRECNNNCEFCFIRGLPKGLRRSLYIRDDDYRYSFLFGTFLTLTNLVEADWERIGFQHLSPLHVSIHATDLAVRRQMLANPAAPDVLGQLDRLLRLGIEVKAQVVLCPGLNDGQVLERTINDLSVRDQVVDSVAIVPVGLTRYSGARTLRQGSPSEARRVVRQARIWQRSLRARLGRDFVYLSDELYLLAGQPFPPAWRYDGYRQLQNGVGLTRLLLADWSKSRSSIPTSLPVRRRVTWVCGRAAAPALRRISADLERVENLSVVVLDVTNDFFGGGVSVSGLLTGQDVVARLKELPLDLAVLPRSAFGYEGRQTLDGWTIEAIEGAAGVRLATGTTAAELLELTLRG